MAQCSCGPARIRSAPLRMVLSAGDAAPLRDAQCRTAARPDTIAPERHGATLRRRCQRSTQNRHVKRARTLSHRTLQRACGPVRARCGNVPPRRPRVQPLDRTAPRAAPFVAQTPAIRWPLLMAPSTRSPHGRHTVARADHTGTAADRAKVRGQTRWRGPHHASSLRDTSDMSYPARTYYGAAVVARHPRPAEGIVA